MPAAIALLRNVLLPMNPVAVLIEANPNGFGFIAARNPRFVALLYCVLTYLVGSPAWAAGTRSKNAAKTGSGEVPGAPVYANVLPRPAAMFACRLACAFRNSSTNPFVLMLISLMLTVSQSWRCRLPTYRSSMAV